MMMIPWPQQQINLQTRIMNPIHKTEHHLKRSIIVDTSNTSHLNPSSTRQALSRKSYGQQPSINNITHFRTDSAHNMSTSHLSQTKNQSYISLGHKHQRQLSKQMNASVDKRVHEMTIRMEKLVNVVERHDRQIATLEKKEFPEMNGKEDNFKQIMNDLISQRDKHHTLQNKLFRADLDTLKFEIKGLVERKDVDKKMNIMENTLKNSLWDIKSKINEEITSFQKNAGEARKRDYELITKEIEDQIRTIKNNFHQLQSKLKKQPDFNSILKTGQKIFHGPTATLKLQTRLYQMKDGYINRQIDKRDIVYHVDTDGYLLDEENRYILDELNRQVRLNSSQMQLLRQYGLMV